MIEYNATVIEETGSTVLKTAPELIRGIQYPQHGQALEHLRRLVDEQGDEVASACRRMLHREFTEADVAAVEAERRLRECRGQYASVESDLRPQTAQLEGSWAKAVICAISVCACFAAEFVLTWHALTFMLNVDKRSPLGVLLGLAPPCALAVLELALSRLLEEPWRRLRALPLATWRGRVMEGLMALFLVALAWGNVRTVLLLAQAREEAAKTQYALLHDDAAAVEPDREVIRLAVVAVSVCVTIDGALFLLLCLIESRAVGLRLRTRREASRLRGRLELLASEAARTRADAEIRRSSWQDGEETARLAAAQFRSQCLFEMEESLTRSRLECEDEVRVRAALAGPHRAGVL
jgi:hypothetical protein